MMDHDASSLDIVFCHPRDRVVPGGLFTELSWGAVSEAVLRDCGGRSCLKCLCDAEASTTGSI